MNRESVIIIAESDNGDFSLIQSGLQGAGIYNPILRFTSSTEMLDCILQKGDGPKIEEDKQYLMLLNVGIEGSMVVVEKIKEDELLKKLPIVAYGSKQPLDVVDKCHDSGCSIYIDKSRDFVNAIRTVGLFLSTVEMPQVRAEV